MSTSSGLSPRVRGSLINCSAVQPPKGSIPACAGEPSDARKVGKSLQVYPRVCGGAVEKNIIVPPELGLSPRVRGSRLARIRAAINGGSIPACAGEPSAIRTSWRTIPVYPRVCGGASLPCVKDTRCLRSIPACAGEPVPDIHRDVGLGVYPRVCGGAAQLRTRPPNASGLSPRVRGSLFAAGAPRSPHRSIPACAGEPAVRFRLWT